MAVKTIQGDALSVLKTLPDESAHCCVTSPPYWGLRDYGVDGQLGLERTPEEYVAKMVEVFSEVRRVLRGDGTLWLNLGTSYAGSWGDSGHRPERTGVPGHQRQKMTKFFNRNGHPQQPKPPTASCCDNGSNQSLLLQRVPACGNGGKEFQCSQGDDRACHGCDDARRAETQLHHIRTVHNALSASQDEQQTSQTGHDNGLADCGQEPLHFSTLDAQESKQFSSSGESSLNATIQPPAFDDRQESQTSPFCVQESDHTLACTSGTSQMLPPLVFRTQGKESFFSACGRSDCKGIGRCGLCWCSLAIPTLNVKPKDELNIPHLVAMALQADGWVLRQTICWNKPNPMPESVTDRCTKSHEFIFLLSKSQRYYYDAEAIKEPETMNPQRRLTPRHDNPTAKVHGMPIYRQMEGGTGGGTRNKRSVWTVATAPFHGAHFATFPPKLIEPCILAGCPSGGTVLDPFGGSGTVGMVAEQNGRNSILIELNPKYVEMAKRRTAQQGLFGSLSN